MTQFKLLLLCIIFLNISVYACTAFVIKGNGTVVLGKNLDWHTGKGTIYFNPAEGQKISSMQSSGKSFEWVSKYKSITFNLYGKNNPCGGMNETGLVIEELNYTPGKYPTDVSLPYLNELEWIQFQLDCHSSVSEVIHSLDTVLIKRKCFNLHYILSDSTGATAVIEFINGKIIIYQTANLPIKALSNNSYANSIKYTRLHKGYGGNKAPLNTNDSQERFVRAAIGIDRIESIFRNSIFTKGIRLLETLKQDDTQWSIVYDIRKREIYYSTMNDSKLKKVTFKTFSLSKKINLN